MRYTCIVLLIAASLQQHVSSQSTDPVKGRLISSTWVDATNGISGEVYAINDRTFHIKDFTYANGDGAAAPTCGNFYVGTSSYETVKDGGTDTGAFGGAIIPDERGTMDILGVYRGGNSLYLTLLEGTVMTEFKYLAVWCEETPEFFGGIVIPEDFEAPMAQNIGRFTTRAHRVSSGEVSVLDSQTILVRDFFYDGAGPDAYWYVGNTDSVGFNAAPLGKIPDETGNRDRKALAYNGVDVLLKLPAGVSAYSIKWLAMYCIAYNHNFGEVTFPSNLNVPPVTTIDVTPTDMDCEQLSDDLQVSWKVEDEVIHFMLAGRVDRTKDYIAFGLSGSTDRVSMIGADVVVADWIEETPRAVDYNITAYAQCAPNGGACPDLNLGGQNNVMMPMAVMTNEILTVSYSRALNTGDPADQIYSTTAAQQIVWAIGPINDRGEAAKHYDDKRIYNPRPINFGREWQTTQFPCKSFNVGGPEVEKPDFKPHHIYAPEAKTFVADIGQSGSEQGYLALTESTSWGIAWYIDGVLIPELHVKRGVEYTFQVSGGDVMEAGSEYHPLYITSSPNGGYLQDNSSRETIYPVVAEGQSVNFLPGPYCGWDATPLGLERRANGYIYQCFETFAKDLERDCVGTAPNTYKEFTWTPDATIPDTVYYQCYTHRNLGWKIHVWDADKFPTERIADQPCADRASGATNHCSSLLGLIILAAAILR